LLGSYNTERLFYGANEQIIHGARCELRKENLASGGACARKALFGKDKRDIAANNAMNPLRGMLSCVSYGSEL